MYSALVFFVIGPILIKAHHLTSPCPDTFEYKRDNTGLHGTIRLRSNGFVSNIFIRAHFTVATRLNSVSTFLDKFFYFYCLFVLRSS